MRLFCPFLLSLQCVLWLREQERYVTLEVIDAIGGDGRRALRLGEDESALEDGLGVEREA
jgi:hypothetical protein